MAPCTQLYCAVRVPFRGNGRPRVQFEGDSITVQAADEILAGLGTRYDVAINAVIGATTWNQRFATAAQAALHPAVEVIELGSDDATCTSPSSWAPDCGPGPRRFDAASVTQRLQHFAQEFPSSTCVVFVTTNDHEPRWQPRNVDVINAYERAHFAHIADWAAAYRTQYFSRPDDPHPNAVGRRALVDLIARSISHC